jgi:glycosyltransferase involved in cell wall biosynthesis
MLLSVVVPARNEAGSLGACLRSLTEQSEVGFALGREWELIVVDDASTDATRAIAEEASRAWPEGAIVLEAPPLDGSGALTGKNNACWAAAERSRGRLLLFTDADTVHEPGSLSRARRELEKYDVALLSYSPRQIVPSLLQRMVMPLIFAELAKAYPPKRVNLAGDRTAAANGQFLMVTAEAYFAVGGHAAVGAKVLEDVALAENIKFSRRGIRLRYAPDALATRMYASDAAMVEGWTKNLALLFGRPVTMALFGLLAFALAVVLPLVALGYPFLTTLQRTLIGLVWLRGVWHFYARVAKSNFPLLDCALSIFGIPVFAWLLLRSFVQVKLQKAVTWKGRVYRPV